MGLAVLWALVGLLLVGPLLSHLIYRLPRLERIAAHLECPHCRAPRPLWAQSSLLATLAGPRGACVGCGARPDRMGLAAEVATGLAFWLLYLRYDASSQLLLYSLYSSFLVAVFFIDWQHRLILNRMTYPGVFLALFLTPLLSPVPLEMALVGLATGGVTFALLYGVGYLVYRQEVMGLGDVKLSMVLGAMAGFPAVVLALLLSSLVGALAAVAFLVMGRGSGRDFMPYGTAMSLGTFLTFLLDSRFLPF